jgi:hypothetical protein
MFSIAGYANSDSVNPSVFPIDSKPFGQPYSQWAAKWWQWAVSIPKDKDPSIYDPSGQRCSINQNDPNVWFLIGVASGRNPLNCNIPYGKAIFMPLLTGSCDYLGDPTIKTEIGLRDCALSGIQGALMHVTIDGIDLKDLQRYYVESPLFRFNITADNMLRAGGGATGSTYAKAAGYYLLLEPLASGRHTIQNSYSIIDNPTIGSYSGASETTYNIEIKP